MFFAFSGCGNKYQIFLSWRYAQMNRFGEIICVLIGVGMNNIDKTGFVFLRNGVAIVHDGVGVSSAIDKKVGSPVATNNVGCFIDLSQRYIMRRMDDAGNDHRIGVAYERF